MLKIIFSLRLLLIFNFISYTYEAIINEKRHMWNTTIKVHMDKKVDKWYIRKALQKIQEHTCLRFIEQSYIVFLENGINFEYDKFNFDCRAERIGMHDRKWANHIFIGKNCYRDKMMILYHILQTLGLYPEDTRIDRDQYVNYSYWNTQLYEKYRFKINDPKKTTFFDTKYDYGSITHYSSKAYSKNPKKDNVLTPLEHVRFNIKTIGQRRMVGFNDYKLINYNYCLHRCRGIVSINCENNGYQDPNKCIRCACPYPFQGQVCDKLIPSGYHCPKTQKYLSGYWEKELSFRGPRHCFIMLQDEYSYRRIEITVTYLDLYEYTPCITSDDVLEIKYKADYSVMGLCLCGFIENYKIRTENNKAIVIYNGKYWGNVAKLTYKSITPCGQRFCNKDKRVWPN
uniref:Metalloendopeptidase n=1 Tax=Parastrongyloides trichosuri TaxID=131310 RepID=A0A0N5A6S7_PARTI